MKSTKNISYLFRTLAVGLIITAASCTPEDELVAPTETPEPAATTSASDETVGSVTISGEFTEFRDQQECSTCSYVVPEDATVVDGAELGIEPGYVICLNKGLKYKPLEFVNVAGTADNPVVIATCGQ